MAGSHHGIQHARKCRKHWELSQNLSTSTSTQGHDGCGAVVSCGRHRRRSVVDVRRDGRGQQAANVRGLVVAGGDVAGLRHDDVAASGLQGLRPPRRGRVLAVRAGARRGVLRGRGGALRRGGGLRGQLAVGVRVHGGPRAAVQLQRVRHRAAAGALRRPASRRRARRRRHPHVLHKVRRISLFIY